MTAYILYQLPPKMLPADKGIILCKISDCSTFIWSDVLLHFVVLLEFVEHLLQVVLLHHVYFRFPHAQAAFRLVPKFGCLSVSTHEYSV